MKQLLFIVVAFSLFSCSKKESFNPSAKHNLVFSELATTWDEGVPLGNAEVGCLVWQNNGKLRFSLDRSDLWDLRPMENIDFDKWKFQDVYEHWKNDNYKEVQNAFDVPYNQLPAPSKILGGALEFDIDALGKVKKVTLDVEKAICLVEWENGAKLTTFVHAEKPLGWYKFENLPEEVEIDLISPAYNKKGDRRHVDQFMADLDQLGYEQGNIVKDGNSFTYDQKGWGDFAYQIHTSWERSGSEMTGVWSVSAENKGWPITQKATEIVSTEIAKSLNTSLDEHAKWWNDYWSRSHIEIPEIGRAHV